MADKDKKPRDELSLDEQEFLDKRMRGNKRLFAFFAGIGLLWSRRRRAFVLCMGIVVVCAFGGEGGEVIGVIATRCITLIKFTEKAYNHGNQSLQGLLEKYRLEQSSKKKTKGGKSKTKKKTNK